MSRLVPVLPQAGQTAMRVSLFNPRQEQIIATRPRAGLVVPDADSTRRAPAPHSSKASQAKSSSLLAPSVGDHPAGAGQANEPLVLSPAMRTALASAARELLQDSRLAGRSPLIKLTAVVLLAKAPLASAVVDMPARDVGGWLGCSVSHVGHTVVPDAKSSGAMLCAPKRSEAGRTEALRFELLPLREARAAADGGPLGTLSKRELATLLRFCEAVTCPGWAPKDKPATPAGFMASRRERGAAADRLAMVLLCLEARTDGLVRMAPGRVARGVRRADATVARLMGCEVEVAAGVVDRLVAAGDLELEGEERAGGGRLRVPAVAAAHARVRRVAPPESAGSPSPSAEEPVQEGGPCLRCAGTESSGEELVLAGEGWAQESLEDLLSAAADCASGDQLVEDSVNTQVSEGSEGASDKSACADLHAVHAPVVSLSGSSASDLDCFSGSAVVGEGRLRERAGAGDDLGEQGRPAEPAKPSPTGAGPLRGEKPGQIAACEGTFRGGRLVFSRPAKVPEELGEALAPVARLWSQIGRSSTRTWLASRVRGEVGRLRGVVGSELAQQVLAERLERRLDAQGPQPVGDLVAWLLKKGLPQRPGCWSTVCDEGVRMDTRGSCESCQVLVGDRRGLRRAVADQVLEERLSGRLVLAEREVGREVERRLKEAVREEMVRKTAARERAVAEQVVREASYELQRQAFAEAKRERAAAPCADCGVPEAAGLCLGCTERRGIVSALKDAVDYALVLRFDPADAPGTRDLRQECAHATRSVLEQRLGQLRQQGLDEASVAYTGRRLIEDLRDRRRRAALVRLGQQEEAEQAARMAAAARRRKQQNPNTAEARDAAAAPGEAARRRVAERWLGELLAELRAVCSTDPAPAELTDWATVLPELAARALPDEPVAAPAGAVGDRVSA